MSDLSKFRDCIQQARNATYWCAKEGNVSLLSEVSESLSGLLPVIDALDAVLQAATAAGRIKASSEAGRQKQAMLNSALDATRNRQAALSQEVDQLAREVASRGRSAEKPKPRRLSEREAAAYLGPVTQRTLQDWRIRSVGPAYTKLGGRVAYDVADLDTFISERRIQPKGGR